VFSLAFAPAETVLASGGNDGAIRLWDTATGNPLGVLLENGSPAVALAFSPNGQTLAVAVDRTVQLWDVAAGRFLARLEGHAGQVQCLAYSPDGTRLASGGYDTTVRLWDVSGDRRK
jgi:WD40 repeat protein